MTGELGALGLVLGRLLLGITAGKSGSKLVSVVINTGSSLIVTVVPIGASV